MRKNSVQFQKGLSLAEFQRHYGSAEACRDAVAQLRWPNGFLCPECGNSTFCVLRRRSLYQCHRCRRQTSVTAGTLFHATKLPLPTWFLALYLVTQGKKGMSSLELGRHLGVSQNTAWAIRHKLMQAMLERDSGRRLDGLIQLDDAYVGGRRRGGKRGRGSPNKTPLVAAVATQAGRPTQLKLSRIKSFHSQEVQRWSRHHVSAEAEVLSDGLACWSGVREAGRRHRVLLTGSGPEAVEHEEFRWVNTVLGNLKAALRSSYHGVAAKHVPRYLAEFQYRFNRRHELKRLPLRLLQAAVDTPPMPCRLLSVAEAYW